MADVKSLAVEVKDHGFIHTAHKLGIMFVDSARKITNTINDIPDIELKENFSKFLKALKMHTKQIDVKNLDSKSLIKDQLNYTQGLSL